MTHHEIAHCPAWTGRLHLGRSHDPAEIQDVVGDLVATSSTTVTGYYRPEPADLTLSRWPENRPEYLPPPSDAVLTRILDTLADRLDAVELAYDTVPPGRLHVLLGRKIDGYGDGKLAPVDDYRADVPDYTVHAAHMISARARRNHTVEPYGEPAVVIEADPRHEALIHAAADKARQHHYSIEHGPDGDKPGYVTLFGTGWAK